MLYALLAFVVGGLTALQSRLNGQLSTDIHNGIAAALISFGTGWILLIAFNTFNKPDRDGLITIFKSLRTRRLKYWEIIGGMGGGTFVAMQSSLVPKLGVAIFTICIVGGQTAASIVVDVIGLSPSGKHHITLIRLSTAIITLASVSVAVFPDLRNSTFKFAPIIATVLVGGLVAFQQALNGRMNVVAGRPLSTTFMNFLMGTFVLTIALTLNLSRGGTIGSLPHNPWIYLGGPIGLIYIAVSALVIKHLGTLNFILFGVTGQLVAALFIDAIAPASHAHVTGYLITGTAMTVVAVLSSRLLTLAQERKR